jgi:hypothetical protein
VTEDGNFRRQEAETGCETVRCRQQTRAFSASVGLTLARIESARDVDAGPGDRHHRGELCHNTPSAASPPATEVTSSTPREDLLNDAKDVGIPSNDV